LEIRLLANQKATKGLVEAAVDRADFTFELKFGQLGGVNFKVVRLYQEIMGDVVTTIFWVNTASWDIAVVLSAAFQTLWPCFWRYSDSHLVNDAEVNSDVGINQRVGASCFVFKRKLYWVLRTRLTSRADHFRYLHEVDPLFSGKGTSPNVASNS